VKLYPLSELILPKIPTSEKQWRAKRATSLSGSPPDGGTKLAKFSKNHLRKRILRVLFLCVSKDEPLPTPALGRRGHPPRAPPAHAALAV